jgi:hypothetical protein
MATGPLTKDTSTLMLGLAQVRIGASAGNIGNIHAALLAANSIGALASTKFTANTEFWKHESGFPLLEDYTIVIREKAALECSFEEITPFNLALANGIDPTGSYTLPHSGEIELGGKTSPEYVRMEALYTFPNGTSTMTIIFPRAQVTSSVELDMQKEDAAASPVMIEAKRADSAISGGHVAWDSKPYGRIAFA